jgi:hypothetical protein
MAAYVLCFCTTVATAFLSDRKKQRGIFLMFWSVFLCIGYAMLIAIPVKYPVGQDWLLV